jgi:hypothetical protein
MSLFCGFCDSLAALVDALFFGGQVADLKKRDNDLDSSLSSNGSDSSDSFEDWCIYGRGTVAQEARDSQGGSAPRLLHCPTRPMEAV